MFRLIFAALLCAPFQIVNSISSGTSVTTNEFRNRDLEFSVAFFTSAGDYFCNGALITTQHIVTAASCFLDVTSDQAKFINRNAIAGIGATKFGSGSSNNINTLNGQMLLIATVKTHPSYNPDVYRYHPADLVDIAVVRLQEHAKMGIGNDLMSHDVYPIPLISLRTAQLIRYGNARVTSFGSTSVTSASNAGELRYIDVDILAGEECQWNPIVYEDNDLYPLAYYNPKNMICSKKSSTSKYLCAPTEMRDIGAALTVQTTGSGKRTFLAGIYVGNPRFYEVDPDDGAIFNPYESNPSDQCKKTTTLGTGQNNFDMYVSLLKWGPWIQQATGVLLSSKYPIEVDTIDVEEVEDFVANVIQTCKSQDCGEKSKTGTCWCDRQCQYHGDCCPGFIFDEDCNTPNIKQEPGCSTPGMCGFKSEECWCDFECSSIGDCCDNYNKYCGEQVMGPKSCVNKCGAKSNGCWCDSECALSGDCCDDFIEACGDPELGDGSCNGRCGMQSGGCWCDPECSLNNDCCINYKYQCGILGSCEGYCGHKSTDKCWCDANCITSGDCCDDFSEKCSHEVLPQSIMDKLIADDAIGR